MPAKKGLRRQAVVALASMRGGCSGGARGPVQPRLLDHLLLLGGIVSDEWRLRDWGGPGVTNPGPTGFGRGKRGGPPSPEIPAVPNFWPSRSRTYRLDKQRSAGAPPRSLAPLAARRGLLPPVVTPTPAPLPVLRAPHPWSIVARRPTLSVSSLRALAWAAPPTPRQWLAPPTSMPPT